jgi:pimeloyl-ACP methyl ester carboxylesterase
MMPEATAEDETPIFFPAGNAELFGILTTPTAEPNGCGILLLTGGNVPTTSRNRMGVHLARRAAALGYHVFRFDYHGVGESTGFSDTFRLDRPFVDDLEAVHRWITQQGISDIVLVGSCFGARTALACAERLSGLRGLALVSMPLRDMEIFVTFREQPVGQLISHLRRRATPGNVIRGLFTHKTRQRYWFIVKTKSRALIDQGRKRMREGKQDELSWVSSNFIEPLARLAERKVPVFFLQGTEDPSYDDWVKAAKGRLAGILQRGGPAIEMETWPGMLHGFPSLDSQQVTIDSVTAWLTRLQKEPGPAL